MNYLRGLDYFESLGVWEVWILEREIYLGIVDGKKSGLREKSVVIDDFRVSLLFL